MPDIENLLNIEDEVTKVLSDLGVNEKLNEMDDFMNQNDLKVQITNENAVVTGLVTYTCTVKDKNNTALPNKVVEWYKGTTLIGIDATDSNGVSTFSHRVTEADIYDVHAIVRGTHAGDDIRMFVKDNSNLIESYNVWSGTDYSKNTNDYQRGAGATIESSNEYCSIGDHSLKITRTAESSQWAGFVNDFELADETIQLTGMIKTSKDNATSIKLTERNSQSEAVQTVSVAIPKDSIQEFSLSLTTHENCESIFCQIISNDSIGTSVYLDNFELTIQ